MSLLKKQGMKSRGKMILKYWYEALEKECTKIKCSMNFRAFSFVFFRTHDNTRNRITCGGVGRMTSIRIVDRFFFPVKYCCYKAWWCQFVESYVEICSTCLWHNEVCYANPSNKYIQLVRVWCASLCGKNHDFVVIIFSLSQFGCDLKFFLPQMY